MYPLCEALGRLADTKALIIEQGALTKVPDLFRSLFGPSKGIVVSGSHTYGVAGEALQTIMRSEGIPMEEPFVFGPDFCADRQFSDFLASYLKTTQAIPLAVGAGAISDVVKFAASTIGRKFIMVSTASSTDGDTSAGVSLTYEGNKTSLEAHAPYAMVADTLITAKAPVKMSSAGYADLLAKFTAGGDWIIADALGEDRIIPETFDMLYPHLPEWTSNPEGIISGDLETARRLAEGLAVSGFSMQTAHSSRPASGLEHQFSHYWEMSGLLCDGRPVSHGFKVAIGVLVSTALMELLINEDFTGLDVEVTARGWKGLDARLSDARRLFSGNDALIFRALYESGEKYIDTEDLERELRRLKRVWPATKERLRAQILPFGTIKSMLRRAGAPYEPETIGVSREELRQAFIRMPYMRKRFTCIDLIERAGLMEKADRSLFGKGGPWEI